MHTLLIILIVLLAILVVFIGIVAFVVLSAYFAVQPILSQLGRLSMIIEVSQFIVRRIQKARIRRRRRQLGDEWKREDHTKS